MEDGVQGGDGTEAEVRMKKLLTLNVWEGM